jgi:hypothetical protein
MPSSFPFALRPGEPKSTYTMMTSFVVTEGKATLVTWETVVNAKTDSDCGTKGSSIRNGRSQNLVHGDIVHIPAGTPHQLIIAGGTMFGAVLVTVKEERDCPQLRYCCRRADGRCFFFLARSPSDAEISRQQISRRSAIAGTLCAVMREDGPDILTAAMAQ